MSRLGVDEATAELAIGHSRGGLVAIYDKHARWNERVEAFERVSNHVAAMISGDSVRSRCERAELTASDVCWKQTAGTSRWGFSLGIGLPDQVARRGKK